MEAQLATVDAEAAARKWEANQPVNVREFAVIQGIGYTAARAMTKLAGFPFFQARSIYREDFTLWRQQQLGLTPRAYERPIGARRRRSTAGRSEK